MDQRSSSVIDLGTDAMLELEEMAQDIRHDAPALKSLFELLRTPKDAPTFAGNSAMSMLADFRAYPVLRDVTGISRNANQSQYEEVVSKFLSELESGVDRGNKRVIKEAKCFCSMLVGALISKNMTDRLARKDSSELRHGADAFI